MPHEPKVGELPALTAEQMKDCLALLQQAHARGAYLNTAIEWLVVEAMKRGIAAEREAWKGEALNKAHLGMVMGQIHQAILDVRIDEALLHSGHWEAALQAEQREARPEGS